MPTLTKLISALTLALASGTLGGCIVATGARYGAYEPAYGYGYETSYGYTTSSVPGTVYYAGGYYGGVYYRPGYYTATAPFVTVYGRPSSYAAPAVVAQPVYGGAQGAVVVQPSMGSSGGATVIAQPIR